LDLSHDFLDITVLPNAATLSIALDVIKLERFEKEDSFAVWMYGQENKRIFLNRMSSPRMSNAFLLSGRMRLIV
jgi:hypothetical protein